MSEQDPVNMKAAAVRQSRRSGPAARGIIMSSNRKRKAKSSLPAELLFRGDDQLVEQCHEPQDRPKLNPKRPKVSTTTTVKLKLRLLAGKVVEVDVDPAITGAELKRRAADPAATGIAVHEQFMVHNRVVLDDGRSLGEQGVLDGDDVFIQVRRAAPGFEEPQPDAHAGWPGGRAELLLCVGCQQPFGGAAGDPHVLACGGNICGMCVPQLHARAVDKRTVICPEPRCHARTIFGAASGGEEAAALPEEEAP